MEVSGEYQLGNPAEDPGSSRKSLSGQIFRNGSPIREVLALKSARTDKARQIGFFLGRRSAGTGSYLQLEGDLYASGDCQAPLRIAGHAGTPVSKTVPPLVLSAIGLTTYVFCQIYIPGFKMLAGHARQRVFNLLRP